MRNESSKDDIFAMNLTLEEEPQAEITVGGQEVNVLILVQSGIRSQIPNRCRIFL